MTTWPRSTRFVRRTWDEPPARGRARLPRQRDPAIREAASEPSPGVTILDQIVRRRCGRSRNSTRSCSASPRGPRTSSSPSTRTGSGCDHLFGHPEDVLSRLIECGRKAGATDVFRVTTESPFFDYSMLDLAWERHVDRTETTSRCSTTCRPARVRDLHARVARAVARGGLGCRPQRALLELRALPPGPLPDRDPRAWPPASPPRSAAHRRLPGGSRALPRGLRSSSRELAPRIPLDRIVAFLDSRPDLVELVAPYNNPVPTWLNQPQRRSRSGEALDAPARREGGGHLLQIDLIKARRSSR